MRGASSSTTCVETSDYLKQTADARPITVSDDMGRMVEKTHQETELAPNPKLDPTQKNMSSDDTDGVPIGYGDAHSTVERLNPAAKEHTTDCITRDANRENMANKEDDTLEKKERAKLSVEKRPIICEEEEYTLRRQDYNPGVGSIPHDFLRFDTTELENPLGELLHADDRWAFVSELHGKEWNIPDVKAEIENGAEQIVNDIQLNGNQAAFARGRMLADSGGLGDRFRRSTNEMQDDGPSYMHQLDLLKTIVARTGERKPIARPKRGDGIITWGNESRWETVKHKM